jgi:hypothetical protein
MADRRVESSLELLPFLLALPPAVLSTQTTYDCAFSYTEEKKRNGGHDTDGDTAVGDSQSSHRPVQSLSQKQKRQAASKCNELVTRVRYKETSTNARQRSAFSCIFNVRSPAEPRGFFLLTSESRPALGPTLSNGYGRSFPRG